MPPVSGILRHPQPVAERDQPDVKHGEDQTDTNSVVSIWAGTRGARLEQDRLGMERAEQVDAQMDERHQQHAENPDHGGVPGSLGRIVHRGPEGQIAYNRQKTNSVSVSRASQVHQVPQIGLAQIGPGGEHDRAEDDAHLRRRCREPIEPGIFQPQRQRAGEAYQGEGDSADQAAGTWR